MTASTGAIMILALVLYIPMLAVLLVRRKATSGDSRQTLIEDLLSIYGFIGASLISPLVAASAIAILAFAAAYFELGVPWVLSTLAAFTCGYVAYLGLHVATRIHSIH